MSDNSSSDHSFLLCELAAILAMLASTPMAVAQDRQTDVAPGPPSTNGDIEREPVTYDHVYGRKRISVGGFSPTRITWIDDDHYIQRDSAGWMRYSAQSGESQPWYDTDRLAAELQTVPDISTVDAKRMAGGAWVEFQPRLRLVVYRVGSRFIRIHLDGTELAIVDGLPEDIELTTLSPNGSAVAFVSNNELWVADFDTQQVRQLTDSSSQFVRNAKADWVYFEEVYSRDWQAYRWSPDGTKLLYQQFDDTDVPTFQISDHTTVEQDFESEHFPKAGQNNPRVKLGVVAISGGTTTWIDTSEYPADDLIISHFNWLPDSTAVYWYAQNRIQTWLDILTADAASGQSHKLLRDETEAWVDNPLDLQFLASGDFLFFSERNGWRHLYRASADGAKITPITQGDWEVRSLLAIDSEESFLIVAGTKDSHIAENIYRVSLSDPHDIKRLTPEEGTHSASTSANGGYFVDSFSSINQPTKIVLRDQSGREIRVMMEAAAVPRDQYSFGTVELRDLPMADGTTNQAVFVLPPGFNPKTRYPVWLRTYGGPHHPQVKNTWGNRLPDHLLANHGIVVITWDPRSASGYGAKSAWQAYRQLGKEETRDLESVCDWLGQQSWVDATRIGLSGHSYGGYFTAYAMTHTDKLCAGIAGAPVTDWANYDTIYTERFMSTPQLNPEGYKNSSVVARASDLKGRLLILHGLKDDNVHPENSIQLIHALQKADRSFDMMFYPTSRHGIHGAHYNKLWFNFVVEAMGKPEARQP